MRHTTANMKIFIEGIRKKEFFFLFLQRNTQKSCRTCTRSKNQTNGRGGEMRVSARWRSVVPWWWSVMSLHGELCVCTTGLYGGSTVVVGCTIAVARRQKRRGPAVDVVVVYDARARSRVCVRVRCTPPARQTAVRAAVVSQLIGTTAARAVCECVCPPPQWVAIAVNTGAKDATTSVYRAVSLALPRGATTKTTDDLVAGCPRSVRGNAYYTVYNAPPARRLRSIILCTMIIIM